MKPATLYAAVAVTLAAIVACSPAPTPPAPATSAAAAAAPADVIPPVTAAADVQPFTIGAFQAAALRDGGGAFPNDNKTIAINKTKADVDALLQANNLPTDTLQLSIQPLLVKTGTAVLLFDTGAAKLFGPDNGKLPASLAAAGVQPAGVTDIFISHGHADHVGGLVTAEGALAFPNATVHISANEWAALKADTAMAALVKTVTPKVQEFQPGANLVPGVKAVDIKGHTPGHSGYLITSGDQSLLYIGDTMHHYVVSVQQPDWTIAYDGDAPTAQASRKQLLADMAASGQRIFSPHFPWPGVGKFEKQGDKFVWVAEQ